MQVYVEIILVAILVVILFNGSITGLKEFANSVLGKAVMVCLIIFISHQFGTNAGLLMAGITIILLQNNIEGFGGKEGIGCIDDNDPNCNADVANLQSRNGSIAYGATKVKGSQSGRQDPDEAPGAKTDKEKREGKINGNGGRKRSKETGVSGAGKKKAAPAAPVEKKKEEPVRKEKEEPVSKEEGKKREGFSNYTLDNAADYTNLGSTLAAYSTNDNIMTSMRASEYAKTAPGGCALMTNHIDTMRIVNNPGSQGIL